MTETRDPAEDSREAAGDGERVLPPRIPTHRADQEYTEVGGLAEVPLAPIAGRAAARLIDGVIVAVPAVAGVLWLGAQLPGWVRAVVLFGVLSVLAIGYEVLTTAAQGATPGKRLAGVRVVRLDTGLAPGGGASLVRCLVLFLPGALPLLGQLVQLCCLASVITDERRHRGWHDRAAGTVVVLDT